MEKNVKVSILLDFYGKLLTEKQFKLLNDYYNNDLSLSEIAENENITRQAVRDNLKKGENNLLEYELKLGLMEKSLKQEKMIDSIISEIENVQNDDEAVKLLTKIKLELQSINNERIV